MKKELQFQEEYVKSGDFDSGGLISLPAIKNKDSFHKLYKRLYLPVFYFACRFVNPEDAEEITADSFLKLWKSDLNYSILPRVKTWLQVCTRNACLDLIKSQNNRAAKLTDFAHLAIDTGSNQEYLIREDLLNRLHLEIEKLPRQCKRVFKMAYLEGRSSRQIAKDIGISENTVSNHRVKALKILKLALADCFLLFVLIYDMQSVFFAHPG